jgi:hypothetical protein
MHIGIFEGKSPLEGRKEEGEVKRTEVEGGGSKIQAKHMGFEQVELCHLLTYLLAMWCWLGYLAFLFYFYL